MKKLLVREQIFAIGAKFDVSDEFDNKLFLVEADKFDIGKNMTVYNHDKSEKYFYLKKVIRLGSHKYKLFDGMKNQLGIIQKELFIPDYIVTSTLGNFEIKGASILGRTYSISKDGDSIGMFHKPVTFLTDYYEIEVYDESFTKLIVAFAILIDMVRFHNNN